MDVDTFCNELARDIENFKINLKDSSMSRSEWMKTFLDWVEWETDVHEEYWEDDYDYAQDDFNFDANRERTYFGKY